MKPWKEINTTSTMGDLVDAFNINAKSGKFLDGVVGTMLCNGIKYSGLETVAEKSIAPLTNINLSAEYPSDILLDNFELYFRENNEFVRLDMFHLDLRMYNTGEPYFLYFRKNRSFRASPYMQGDSDECLFARFVLRKDYTFNQFYIIAPRVGVNMYNAAGEFFELDGCYVKTPGDLRLSMTSGKVKRAGIDFTDKNTPDIKEYTWSADIARPLRYVTNENKVDYDLSYNSNVITDKYLDYNELVLKPVPKGKYTIQRILWDIYDGSLILQYGDRIYDTYEAAIAASSLQKYPAPFNRLIYIPNAMLIVKSGTTNLKNTENLIFTRRDLQIDEYNDVLIDPVAQAKADEALRQIEQEVLDRTNGDKLLADEDTKFENGTRSVGKAQTLLTGKTTGEYRYGDYYLNYSNATNKPLIDSTSLESLQPVANETIERIIKLHKVAKSGKYDDLVNKLEVVNNLSESSYNNRRVLSAYQGYLLNQNKLSLDGGTMRGTINSKTILPTECYSASNRGINIGTLSKYYDTMTAYTHRSVGPAYTRTNGSNTQGNSDFRLVAANNNNVYMLQAMDKNSYSAGNTPNRTVTFCW